jgi:hypothetical protein
MSGCGYYDRILLAATRGIVRESVFTAHIIICNEVPPQEKIVLVGGGYQAQLGLAVSISSKASSKSSSFLACVKASKANSA